MSFTPQVSFEQKKSWLWGRYSSTYQAQLAIGGVLLSRLINGFMQLVVPEVLDARNNLLLSNVKGRNASDTLLPGLPSLSGDETFMVAGEIAVGTSKKNREWEPFDVRCVAHFKEFAGANEIRYAGETSRSATVPSWLPARLIGAAAPVRPRFFRFAVEHFRVVQSFASMGSMPQVTESLLVDCSESVCAVRLTIDSKQKPSHELLRSIPCAQSSSHVLSSIVGWNYLDDLSTRMLPA